MPSRTQLYSAWPCGEYRYGSGLQSFRTIGALRFEEAARIVRLLARYHLPVDVDTDHARVFEVLKMDKKRKDDAMQFIILNKIGSASVVSIRSPSWKNILKRYCSDSHDPSLLHSWPYNSRRFQKRHAAYLCAGLLHRAKQLFRIQGRKQRRPGGARYHPETGGGDEEIKDEALRIKNDGECRFAGTIHCGESGLGYRMFTPSPPYRVAK